MKITISKMNLFEIPEDDEIKKKSGCCIYRGIKTIQIDHTTAEKELIEKWLIDENVALWGDNHVDFVPVDFEKDTFVKEKITTNPEFPEIPTPTPPPRELLYWLEADWKQYPNRWLITIRMYLPDAADEYFTKLVNKWNAVIDEAIKKLKSYLVESSTAQKHLENVDEIAKLRIDLEALTIKQAKDGAQGTENRTLILELMNWAQKYGFQTKFNAWVPISFRSSAHQGKRTLLWILLIIILVLILSAVILKFYVLK